MKTNKELARSLIRSYFCAMGESINTEGIATMLELSNDDEALLEHIKAWISILTKAKEEIENEN